MDTIIRFGYAFEYNKTGKDMHMDKIIQVWICI